MLIEMFQQHFSICFFNWLIFNGFISPKIYYVSMRMKNCLLENNNLKAKIFELFKNYLNLMLKLYCCWNLKLFFILKSQFAIWFFFPTKILISTYWYFLTLIIHIQTTDTTYIWILYANKNKISKKVLKK